MKFQPLLRDIFFMNLGVMNIISFYLLLFSRGQTARRYYYFFLSGRTFRILTYVLMFLIRESWSVWDKKTAT